MTTSANGAVAHRWMRSRGERSSSASPAIRSTLSRVSPRGSNSQQSGKPCSARVCVSTWDPEPYAVLCTTCDVDLAPFRPAPTVIESHNRVDPDLGALARAKPFRGDDRDCQQNTSRIRGGGLVIVIALERRALGVVGRVSLADIRRPHIDRERREPDAESRGVKVAEGCADLAELR